MKLTLGQVADWIHAEGDFTTAGEVTGYSIDSRTVGAGELFFAVRGEHMDGHDYVETALAQGAAAAVVSRAWMPPDEPERVDPCKLLWVPENGPPPNAEDNVLRALQTLAARVRKHWGGRVIGVTGSAGKTTTKEALAAVLGAQFNVLKSAGNLNNHFGVPLQLLRLEPTHQVAVIEMGMNHAGEIAALARIAEPDWGVVSNVAAVHLEFFPDGLAGIARAKQELIDSLPADGIAFLNADDPLVAAMAPATKARTVLYGFAPASEVSAQSIVEAGLAGVRFTVHARGEEADVSLQLMGRHNVHNALAAIAVGLESGVPLPACAAAIATLAASDKRGSLLHWHGATLVNDCYNSNPHALDAMVDALLATPATRRIVVAGEMLELGESGAALHRASGARMRQLGVDVIVGVRGLAQEFGGLFFATPADAGAWLAESLRPGDVVLLKASRGVRLEAALDALRPQDQ